MTKEEQLKQEAEEKLLQAELDYCHELSNPCEPSELPYSELLRFETGYKRGYLASAEPREKRIAELEKELEQAKKVQVVEHFEAYGQCRDSRRIASLEKEIAELKDKLKNLASVAEVRLANWQKYEKENAELKTQAKKIILKLYNAGRDVLMCRTEEKAYENLSHAINDRSIEQFLKESEEE